MIIDLYSNIYNEEALLPYWLRYYETFVDRIFVWDDGSTDSTLEILNKHPKVTILPKKETSCEKCNHVMLNGYSNDHYWIHNLFPQYEQYSTGVSDWVIVADADEFIYHPNIREILENPKVQRRKVILCQGFNMVSDKLPITNGQIYEEIKMGIPDKEESKWTIHSSNIDGFQFRIGRHGPPIDFQKYRGDRATGIKLLHYRFLGEEYTESRDKKNFERQKLANPLFVKEYCPHARRTCPDGTKDNIYSWLDNHKGDIVNVIDD
jgi:glycosyltransferase involved in cell wall biosynthesis